MNILIIEDETAAAKNLSSILSSVIPEANILATIDTVVDSVEWLESNPAPDIIFMDIHLSDGESFKIFEKVKVLLLYRIYSNLYSSLLLTAQVLKTGKNSFFQLPIGLLLLYRLFVCPIHATCWQGTNLRGTRSENNRVCQLYLGAQRGIQRPGEKYGKDT
jgi:CheY-like chemotaxis protein